MKRWKFWVATGVFSVFAVAVALTVAAWDNVSSEWTVERAAAQYALNHSPLDHIKRHQVFTANQAQEVFYGSDAFGRSWYVFVYGDPFVVHAALATPLWTRQQIVAVAAKEHVKTISARIGYLGTTAASTFHTTPGVVWEVYGTQKNGHPVFLYFHADSGKPIP